MLASLKIIKFIVQELGTFNDVYTRPYMSHVSHQALDTIVDRVESNKRNRITGALLAGVSGGVIQQSAKPEKKVYIPGGMQERRLKFVLVVEITYSTQNVVKLYIQGYTEFMGLSFNNTLDPNMQWYINSYTKTNEYFERTPNGLVKQERVIESVSVINGAFTVDRNNSNPNTFGMTGDCPIRPLDIFHGMQAENLALGYQFANPESTLLDTRGRIGEEVIPSVRRNNVGTNYLADIIDVHVMAQQTLDFGQGNDNLFGRCVAYTQQPAFLENPFLRALSNIRGSSNVCSFTINELLRIDPNLQNVTDYLALNQQAYNQLPQAGQSEYWSCNNIETQLAFTIGTATLSLMADLLFGKLSYSSTNQFGNGRMETIITGSVSLSGSDLRPQYNLFINRLETEVLFSITYANELPYNITVEADINGSTVIHISINNSNTVRYVLPTMADSLFPPIMTSEVANRDLLVNDLQTLLNDITTIQSNYIL